MGAAARGSCLVRPGDGDAAHSPGWGRGKPPARRSRWGGPHGHHRAMTGFGEYFSALWAARTWRRSSTCSSGSPVAIVLFTYAAAMYATGLGARDHLGGVFLLIAVQASMRPIGAFERGLVNGLLDGQIDRPAAAASARERATASRGGTLLSLANDAHSWRVLAWITGASCSRRSTSLRASWRAMVPIAVVAAILQAGAHRGRLGLGTQGEGQALAPWVLLGAPIAFSVMPLFAWAARRHRPRQHEVRPMGARARASRSASRRSPRARNCAEEQVRIDQELHDRIGHMITMTIVQAGAGAHVFDSDPGFARQALTQHRGARPRGHGRA